MDFHGRDEYTKGPPSWKDALHNFFARTPKDVDGVANRSSLYYRGMLMRRLFGCYKFDNIPETWDEDYMLTHLFLDGFFCITDTTMGVLPLECGITGQNVYRHPTRCVIANPVLGNFEKIIDEDCALIKLQWNYFGINELLTRYSTMLAMCDSSIAVNLMNSKVTFVAFAEDRAQAETMKYMYDKISSGEPAVFIRKGQVEKGDFYFNHVRNNFVAEDIQNVQRRLINQFLTDVGINNADTDKRERLITDEVMANDSEVKAASEHWLENVKQGINVANKLFGLNVTFRRKEFQGEGVDKDAQTRSDIE